MVSAPMVLTGIRTGGSDATEWGWEKERRFAESEMRGVRVRVMETEEGSVQ